MRHVVYALAGAVALEVLALAPSWAQVDVVKALVGKWQGEVQFRDTGADRDRTLVIESVERKDGALIATARYGTTGKNLERVNVDVQTSGGEVNLGFGTRAGATIRLKLFQEKYLVGSYRFRGTRQHNPEVDMKLEKVQ